MSGIRYLIAGRTPWVRRAVLESKDSLPGVWRFVSDPDALTSAIAEVEPRYIFFLHWSTRVPAHIVTQYECVCFHMTDVPFGRGGSPLQNLIARGHRETMLTALRMEEALDAGPVYAKEPLSLEGGAEEIYLRASRQSVRMLVRLMDEAPVPQPQTGDPVVFRRRTPDESRIVAPASLDALFDQVRMLDAEGYPHAFLEYGGFRFEFTRAARYEGRVVSDVSITRVGENA